MTEFLAVMYPYLSLLMLVAIWVYFFLSSYRHNVSWPWGFIILLVGIPVSGTVYDYGTKNSVLFSLAPSFVIILIGVLLNITNIWERLYIREIRKGLFFSGIGLLMGLLFGFSFIMAKVTEYLQGGAQYTPFALIALSIQKSIAEEFLFRGYLFNYLRKYNFNPLFAILFQSLIFTALHTYRYADNWVLLSIIFLFGIIGGYLTWKSENLIPASIMHIVVNLFSVVWRLS